jgi:hypothetical protein
MLEGDLELERAKRSLVSSVRTVEHPFSPNLKSLKGCM